MHVLIGTRNLFFSANGRGRRGAEGPHGAGIQAATDTQRRRAETAAQEEKHQENILRKVRQSSLCVIQLFRWIFVVHVHVSPVYCLDDCGYN